MKKNKVVFSLFLISLLLSSLACTIFVGGPEYPPNPVPFSPEALESLRIQIEQAMIAGAETGAITLQINETQLTSYLILKLQERTNPPFTDPQVLLRNGQMQVLGKVHRGIFLANLSIILNVTIDELGKPKIEVASTDFGPFPAPEGLNSAIGTLIDEAFTGPLGPVATGFRLESIVIADGLMTLSGRIK
jgi:hypothetical protein